MPYLGEICALLTALCWTGSSTLFAVASRAVGPLPANQFRLYAAIPVLLVLGRVVTGMWWPSHASDERIALLAASSLVGLVLGDIGLFYALATIGPRLSSVVMAGWPGVTVAIEAACGRPPSWPQLAGIAITMLGVGMVLLRNREGSLWNPGLTPRQWWLGLAGAAAGAIGQAGGFVLAGVAMEPGADLPGGLDPLQATVVRMVTGVVGLQLVAIVQRQPFAMKVVFGHPLARKAAMVGALFGPVAGVWLSMVSRRHSEHAGMAAALMATTPIFMMPVAAWLYGARIGWLGLIGSLVAAGGAAVCWPTR
ncbi:MAG: DMT family transporter [Planctomycetes bacterium]|jgi:drug/metabolite transporter (DMT)-like permease|nr:DMT family transporter [Planctomycetota bacterium]